MWTAKRTHRQTLTSSTKSDRDDAGGACGRGGSLLMTALLVSTCTVLTDAWQPQLQQRKAFSPTRLAPLRWLGNGPTSPAKPTKPTAREPLPRLSVSTSTQETIAPPEGPGSDFPSRDKDGIYHVENKRQYVELLNANADKLVVLKVYAPWCRACKGLENKFLGIVRDKKYADLPIVWADLSIQHNKAFIQSLGVLALPTIQFYVGKALQETFPCGPSKVPILKKKLAKLINENVDPANTSQLRESSLKLASSAGQAALFNAPPFANGAAAANGAVAERPAVETAATASPPVSLPRNDTAETPPVQEIKRARDDKAGVAVVTDQERAILRKKIPYFAEMSIADMDDVMEKAKVLKFKPGSVIMREGKPGRKFYVLKEGEVEILQRTNWYQMDPMMATPSSYLGTVINRLVPNEYFGERALITGEARAASIRASEQVVLWSFDKTDFPASSVLSGKTKVDLTSDDRDYSLASVNDKYGLDLDDLFEQAASKPMQDVMSASQVRGSPNTPEVIRGVDTEEDTVVPFEYKPVDEEEKTEDAIFSLLTRFQMIRQVSRCFDYIVQTKATWGDEGVRIRRSMLVQRLTPAQRAEFRDAFHIIDTSGDGLISLLELKRVMESIGEAKSDGELVEMISEGAEGVDGTAQLTLQDFMGIMAEAEFYTLFRDIFSSLDATKTGYVKAGDLDRVLQGVRDLVSDDRKSIIDIDDDDMLIDYEQFSRMLLGTALI